MLREKQICLGWVFLVQALLVYRVQTAGEIDHFCVAFVDRMFLPSLDQYSSCQGKILGAKISLNSFKISFHKLPLLFVKLMTASPPVGSELVCKLCVCEPCTEAAGGVLEQSSSSGAHQDSSQVGSLPTTWKVVLVLFKKKSAVGFRA